MRKISTFLAALLVFTALAVSFGPAQNAQAFSFSEIDYSEFERYTSGKAGEHIYFGMNLDYEEAKTLDLTGWKAALCPAGTNSLSDAVAVFDITNENKNIHSSEEWGQWAQLNMNGELKKDIPDGYYSQFIFDADGNIVYDNYGHIGAYVNKILLSYDACVMNDDGYAYAYVYSENPAVNASTYPTLYASDKKTAITSFEDYKITISEYGRTVHNYKLKILDDSEFTYDDGEAITYFYYKAGTPCVKLPEYEEKAPESDVSGNDVSGNDVSGEDTENKENTPINDGGIGLSPSDEDGFSYMYVRDMNKYVEKYNLDWEIKSPFEDVDDEDAEDEDDDEDEESASANVGGESIDVSVDKIKESDVPTVQNAINNIVSWVSQIASKPTEVVKVLNQYAPAMKVSKVLAGGTLELELEDNVDISSGATITFTNEEISEQVKSGDKVIVLHVKHDGAIEYIPATAGDGSITATFKSLSPVAWYKVEASGNSNSVSPKTGISFWNFLRNLFN